MRKVVVDVETTGFSALRGGRVIEIGAVAVENGVIVAELGTLIDTGAEISYGAFRVHGISAAMLEGKPDPAEVWGAFREFAGDADLIAHNSPFDSAFVRHELGLIGHGLPNRWHCSGWPGGICPTCRITASKPWPGTCWGKSRPTAACTGRCTTPGSRRGSGWS